MKKNLLFVSFILFLASVLIACSSNPPADGDAANMESAAIEKTEISVWVMGTDEVWRSYHDDLVKRFEEINNDITVNLEYIPWGEGQNQLISSAANQTLPDVSTIAGRWTAQMVEMGVVEPLDEFFPEGYKEEFVPAAFNTTQYKDQTWGLPVGFTTTGLFYRQDWLEEAGYTEPPKTWDEFLDVATSMTKDDRYGFGLVGHNSMETTLFWVPFLWSNGGELLNENGTQATFNSKEGIEALQFYIDLYKNASPEGSINYKRGDSQNLFLSGAVGMTTVGPWFPKSIKSDAADMKYGIAPYPVAKEPVNMGTADHIVMFNTTEHKEAAWKFVEFFTNQENDLAWAKKQGFIPYRTANLEDEEIRSNPDMAFFLDVATQSRTYPTLPEWPQIDQAIADAVQQALMGEMTPEEALNEAAEKVNTILAE
ncbi:ABC transporter substrate-binding protein [Bacillus sp. Marseille-P3661]|uniref:ABC transporter substrate-binding protein n=1 Tax=Bacillus sp. Marseille-P3661 TaxID=1936234 RepID=UPI000C852E72|nr:sugar ABC transporter substrate-binding protein [Bacillus sp. Marseille-P3661]